MPDLTLRRLEYFIVLAEELNYSRAAERLHVAQPVLSRQIAVLEGELGVRLFERSTRGTRLSAAGSELLADARTVAESAEALVRRATVAARGVPRLALGFMPGLIVTPLVRALRERIPALEVDVVRTSWDDQVATIRDGRVDLGLVRPPFDQTGLRVEPLFREPRLVVLPASHPLASAPAVSLADLVALPLLQSPDAVPEWRDARVAAGFPLPPAGAHPIEVEVKLERVAAGAGFAVLPASTTRFYSRPDVVAKVVPELAPGTVALAWDARRATPPLAAGIEIAHTLGASALTGEVLDGSGSSARG